MWSWHRGEPHCPTWPRIAGSGPQDQGFLCLPWRKGQPFPATSQRESFSLFGWKALTKASSVAPESQPGWP